MWFRICTEEYGVSYFQGSIFDIINVQYTMPVS